MSQTVVRASLTPAVAGMLADTGNKDTISKLVEDSGGIAFGLGVIQGTAQNQAKLPAGAIAGFLGVSQHEHSEQEFQTGATGYAQYDPLNILQSGRIWVQTTAALTVGGDIFLWHTGANIGWFGPVTDANNAQITAGARVVAISGTALALIDFNLPT